jgi:2-dehydropantoate 2-reductase
VKACIIGGGSIGCLLAAYLVRGGTDITIIQKSSAAPLLDANGLDVHVVPTGDQFSVHDIHLADDLVAIGECDAIIVATKAFDISEVMDGLNATGLVDPRHHAIVLVQNGLGIESIAQQRLPGVPIIRLTTTNGAVLRPSGHIDHAGVGNTFAGPWLGPWNDNSSSIFASLIESFNAGGLPAEFNGDMVTKVWEKLVINVGINAIAAMFRVENGRLLAVPELLDISRHLVDEAMAVAAAEGQLVDVDGQGLVLQVLNATAQNRNSMLQDIEKGRKTEIDFINGTISRLGVVHEIPTPWNEAIVALIHALESVRP